MSDVQTYLPYVDIALFIIPVVIILFKSHFKSVINDNNKKCIDHIDKLVIKYQKLYVQPSSKSNLPIHDTACDFPHQVAGHTSEILRRFRSKVLKPMVKPLLFLRELELYEEMQILGDHSTQIAKSFVPQYFGVMKLENGSSSLPYLILKDLTLKYNQPCAMDIKMGTQTFEPSASNDKKTREHLKYCYQKTIGFRITGFKVYDIKANSFYSVGKKFGRSLKPEQIKDGLSLFFYNGNNYRRDILTTVISKLEKILIWLKSQTKLHFYCSSILIVYDGNDFSDYRAHLHRTNCKPYKTVTDLCNEVNVDMIKNSLNKPYNGKSTDQHNGHKEKLADFKVNHNCYDDIVQVRMIDFAHTLTSEISANQICNDEGYIIGLTNLIMYLQLIVLDIDKGVIHNSFPIHLQDILKTSSSITSFKLT